jgi:phosphatidyl-myo-inositol dimannoside synthase
VDVVLAVSEFTRKKFWAWAQPETARSFLLPNCVDLAQFTPGSKNPALLNRYGLRDKIVMLTVARLSALERYKGIDQVLEVIPALGKEIPNLAYLIVGDGSDRTRLMEKARTLGLRVSSFSASDGEKVAPPHEVRPGQMSNPRSILHPPSSVSTNPAPHVIFAGHIPESEKVEHYQLADAFVMPGWGEGFGIVYLEAMACGVPVVASKLDASQEAVLSGKIGNLVNPRVPEEIISGTLTALRSPKGVPAGLDHFSQAHFQRRVHAIVGELAAR